MPPLEYLPSADTTLFERSGLIMREKREKSHFLRKKA
jgi:hypothetical protein